MQNAEPSSDWMASLAPNSQQSENVSLPLFHSLLASEDPPSDAAQEKCCETGAKEVSPLIDVFEEDARSSWGEEPAQVEFKESPPRSSSKNSNPPERLLEYSWPPGNGESFILQEQLSNFLKVDSFQEKYPDLGRRTVEGDEKLLLRDRGLITEIESSLTALRSEEVFELLIRDFPEQYKECFKALRGEENRAITEKQKEVSSQNKMIDLAKKAMQSAADYNAHLNQERREERKSCMDLQTYTLHFPLKKNSVKKSVKPGKYPVALLPGQFQDYYHAYTPEELKYLPVNSVLYGPPKELSSLKAMSEGSQSDSDDSTASDGSDSSSHEDSSSGSEVKPSAYQAKAPKPNSVCKVCKLGCSDDKPKAEQLVVCSECENCTHPSCIELTPEVVSVISTYPWQCMDCKVCSHCRDPNDEDRMLFCDTCDRGYHTFCVGLKSLPQGKWICRQCGCCSVCGTNKPGPESSKVQWHFDGTRGNESSDKPTLICSSCHKKTPVKPAS